MAFTVSWIYKAIDKYTPTINKVKRSTDKLGDAFGKADRKTKKFNFSLKKLQKSLRSSGKKMRNFGAMAVVGVTLPVALIGKSMLQAASDAVETTNKFNQVFELGAKGTNIAAKFAKDYGLAQSTSERMLSATGDLLVGFKFAEQQALDLSVQVSELASDLASFQNFAGGAEGASLAITKALLGETESAKALGIVIRQLSPEFMAMVKHFQRTQGVTLQQAKALTVLAIASDQSRKAIGDVSRTWADFANVQRRASEDVIKLSESFGIHLIPIATKVLLLFSKLTEKFAGISPEMKKFIMLIAGLTAILPPLILLAGLLGLAFGYISLPILIIGAAVVALIAGFAALYIWWDKIKKLIMDSGTVKFLMATYQKVSGFVSGPSDFSTTSKSSADINVNMNDPNGAVKSVDTKTTDANIIAKLARGYNTAHGAAQ